MYIRSASSGDAITSFDMHAEHRGRRITWPRYDRHGLVQGFWTRLTMESTDEFMTHRQLQAVFGPKLKFFPEVKFSVDGQKFKKKWTMYGQVIHYTKLYFYISQGSVLKPLEHRFQIFKYFKLQTIFQEK